LPRARADLQSITDFIAQDNPRAAKNLIVDLRARCVSLQSHPLQGRAAPAIGPGVRILPFRSYLILYRVEADIEIDRVIHGARDLNTVLVDET
jgi:toxin ParE1/3/4